MQKGNGIYSRPSNGTKWGKVCFRNKNNVFTDRTYAIRYDMRYDYSMGLGLPKTNISSYCPSSAALLEKSSGFDEQAKYSIFLLHQRVSTSELQYRYIKLIRSSCRNIFMLDKLMLSLIFENETIECHYFNRSLEFYYFTAFKNPWS